MTAAQPVPESVKNDIVKVVRTAQSANNGAALDDADVIMLLTWALRYIDQSELSSDARPSAQGGAQEPVSLVDAQPKKRSD